MTDAEKQAWENKEYRDWFNKNIYNLAKEYASRNPIQGIDKEDYVQELVSRVWRALPKYDPKKAKLSTFAFLWFGSKRQELLRSIIRANNGFGGPIESLNEEVTDDGCEAMAKTPAEEPDYPLMLDIADAYASVCVECRMYCEGYAIRQISKALSKPMDLVKQAIDADISRLREQFGAGNV